LLPTSAGRGGRGDGYIFKRRLANRKKRKKARNLFSVSKKKKRGKRIFYLLKGKRKNGRRRAYLTFLFKGGRRETFLVLITSAREEGT